jgi:hypothetical protein
LASAGALAGLVGCGGSHAATSRDAGDAGTDRRPSVDARDAGQVDEGTVDGPAISGSDAAVGPEIVAGFNALPALITPRTGHTATALANGTVLVVGGQDEIYSGNVNVDPLYEWKQTTLGTAEVHDVRAATVRATGSLITARHDHTATLLPSGQVLIAGGGDQTSAMASAELYDPETGTFTSTGALINAREYHTATLLPNGQVLVAGGRGATTDTVAPAELYDPATGTFTTTGSMLTPRYYDTATLLPNGKVLFAGGYVFGVNPAQVAAELYDPASGTFTATGPLTVPRYDHSATLLPDGKVLIAGGTGNNNAAGQYVDYPSAELYDPAAGTFSATGGLSVARYSHTASLLLDGDVLIAGGQNHNGLYTYLPDAELYHPATGTFSTGAPISTVRSGHTATTLADGRVFIAGGVGGGTIVDIYDPTTARFTARATFREGHTVTPLAGGQILFVGGGDLVLTATALYDAAAMTFTPTGDLNVGRSGQTATVLADGRVFIVGGSNTSNNPLSGEIYSPAAGTWSSTPIPVTQRENHTATLLGNGKVLIAGGAYANPIGSTDLFDPATSTFTASGPLMFPRGYHTATLLPSGQVLLAGGLDDNGAMASAELYDPTSGTCTPTGSMHVGRFAHSATVLPDKRVLIVGGWSGTRVTGTGLPDVYTGQAVPSAELYDPTTGTFSTVPGALTHASYAHAAALRLDGTVLIVGGTDSADPEVWGTLHRTALSRAELYDPTTGTFTPAGTMNIPRDSPTATTLGNGDVLIAGGNAAGLNGNYTLGMAEIYH